MGSDTRLYILLIDIHLFLNKKLEMAQVVVNAPRDMRLFVGVWLWAGSTHVNYVIEIERLPLCGDSKGKMFRGRAG
jgi:hypothetical protein